MANIRKKLNKDGSISYEIRVSNGYRKDGTQITVSRTFKPDPKLSGRQKQRELRRQVELLERQVQGGLLPNANMKLDDLIAKWLKEHAEKQLKPQTIYNYKKLMPRVSQALGHLPINKIRPVHIMEFYENLEEDGVRLDTRYIATKALKTAIPYGKKGEVAQAAGISSDTVRLALQGNRVTRSTAEKLSAALHMPLKKAFTAQPQAERLNRNSIQHYHRMLSSIFSSAVRWQLMEDNPCSRVSPPKAEDVDIEFLDETQIAKLFEALADAPVQYSVIVQLALFTGCRRGEICGLRWSDIDFDNSLLSIRRSLTSIPGQGQVFSTPKTKRSRRCIKIEPDAVELLRDYRRYQTEERFKVGSRWPREIEIMGKMVENDLLFTTWDGHPIDPGSVSSWFPGFLREHGLPPVRFHSLRHTNASLLIAAHVPVVTVAGRLGHAQASTTANIYADMIQTSDAAAADALDAVFSRIKNDTQQSG